ASITSVPFRLTRGVSSVPLSRLRGRRRDVPSAACPGQRVPGSVSRAACPGQRVPGSVSAATCPRRAPSPPLDGLASAGSTLRLASRCADARRRDGRCRRVGGRCADRCAPTGARRRVGSRRGRATKRPNGMRRGRGWCTSGMSFSTMHKSVPPPLDDASAALTNPTAERPWAGLPTGEEADVLLGRSLNDTYVIEAALGEGGMGRIYRARHTRIPQKLFAIKVLRPELARNPGVQARFQREAETAACISHPNVVGVYDVGRTLDGWSYLVCEFLEGADLAAYIEQKGRLDTATAVHIALQVCDALTAAHERNVVHRDLKPHNVFLLADGTGEVPERPTIKVLDFGLSRFLDTSDAQLTRTGVIMGTPAYMAPEQARAERGDHRVDIYGLGTVLYATLTGQAPFKEDNLHATVLAVMTGDPERPRTLNPDIPEALELVIQRAMAKDAKDRYATMAELRAALEPFDASQPARGKPQKLAKATNPHRGSWAMIQTDDFE